MTEKIARRYRRPRLDAAASARLREEVAKFDVPPASEQIAERMRGLRDVLAVPVEDTDAVSEAHPEASDDDSGDSAAADLAARPVGTPAVKADTSSRDDVEAPVPASGDAASVPAAAALMRTDPWADLRRIPIDASLLDRNLVITAGRTDPAHASFDVMRTRLVQALGEKKWRRVAITSPTKGCGKTFTAVNLAVTLSRYANNRTLLLDMDLRHPALARYLGVTAPGSMGDVLRGERDMAGHLRRPGENALHIGTTLALGLNDRPETFAAELLQQQSTADALNRMHEDFAPDVVLYDLPPALAHDDVMAFRPHFDCVLLVVGGGITTAADIKEVHRRLGEDKPVMGVILNMAEDDEDNTY